MDDGCQIKVQALYGMVVIRSWFELDGDKLVGMGSKAVYDESGALIEVTAGEPTGVVMRFS